MSEAAPHLVVRGVSKKYGPTTVLDHIDLTIRRGELVTLLGPSGCGKTTLLRAIAGLAQPDTGKVELAGRDVTHVPPHKRNVGVVFQSYALFPHLTVAGNIAFGLKVRGAARREIDAAVERALSLVKLGHLAGRRISALSGGQQQRVALARAIAVEPDVLLFDEALSALDRKLREEMQVELRRLLQDVKATAIFVTHDQDEALTMSDRVAVMNKGRIEQIGDPETLYTHPANPFVCRFLGEVNELPAALHARWTGIDDERVVAFVRPHDIEFSAGEGGARVEQVRDLGANMRVEVRHPALAQPLVAVWERSRFARSGLAPGRSVVVSAQRQVLFRGDEPVDAAERAGNALRDILVTQH